MCMISCGWAHNLLELVQTCSHVFKHVFNHVQMNSLGSSTAHDWFKHVRFKHRVDKTELKPFQPTPGPTLIYSNCSVFP